MTLEAPIKPHTRRVYSILWVFLAALIFTISLKNKIPDHEWRPFSDQSSHLIATISLWEDHDLRYTRKDLDRFRDLFPATQGPSGAFLKLSKEGHFFFAKPALYAALNAPFYGAFGTAGFLIVNLLALGAMAALTQRIARRVYGEIPAHLMAAALFSMGPFMAWSTVIHPDLLIALLLYLGGYLVLTYRNTKSLCGAGLLLGFALAEKPTFAVILPFLIMALPAMNFKKLSWLILGIAFGWILPAAVSYSQDGNLLAYQGIRFLTARRPFPEEEGWTLPVRNGIAHIFNIQLMWNALTGNIFLLPSKLIDFFVGRQTGLLLYFPVALLFLITCFIEKNTRSLLLVAGLFTYLGLNAFAFPDNGFGGSGSYGSRYLMQALPLLMLALQPLGRDIEIHGVRFKHGVLAYPAVILTLIFQHSSLPPSGHLVQYPSSYLKSAPATWFPLERSLLPSLPIYTPGYRINDDEKKNSIFSRDIREERVIELVDGKATDELTIYRHDSKSPLPVLTINSSVDANVHIKPTRGQERTTSVTLGNQKTETIPASFFGREVFSLMDKRTKQWADLTVEVESIGAPNQPAFISYSLTSKRPQDPASIPLNRDIAFREFETFGIIPRFNWGSLEKWGSWTDGKYADLLIPMPSNQPAPKIIRLLLKHFTSKNNPKNTIEIFINGKKETYHTFTSPEVTTLDIPISNQDAGKSINLGFRILNPTSPLALGLSQDTRTLGLGLISLKMLSTTPNSP